MKPKVSLTDSYLKFTREFPSNDSKGSFCIEGTLAHIKSSLETALSDFAAKAKVYLTVCNVYKEIAEMLEKEPKERIHDFLVDYIRKTTDRLISDKKLYGTLINKACMESLKEELKGYETDTLLKTIIPSRLSFLTTGKFAKRYEEALNSLDGDKPTIEAKEAIELIKEEEENAESLLYTLEHSFDLLAEEEKALVDKEISFDIDGDHSTEAFVHDRVLRVFLLIESYRRLCTANEIKNSTYLAILQGFLQVWFC